MKARTKSFSTNQLVLKIPNIYFISYYGKTKILKIYPFLNFLAIFVTLKLVPDVRRMTTVNTISLVPLIQTKISQKRMDLVVLAVSKSKNVLSVKRK